MAVAKRQGREKARENRTEGGQREVRGPSEAFR